ncbi:MAG: hypothetical protein E7298_03970 [Lachnospiraceae bacterium]|nr:hypothetical protein [Lachnospiraceae bacterium]
MSNYEVKILLRDDLEQDEKAFIIGYINDLSQQLGMTLDSDGITYSKKEPYKQLEDIPAGFKFYNKLRKYKDYFSIYEYYSYLEGDYNGTIRRNSLNI